MGENDASTLGSLIKDSRFQLASYIVAVSSGLIALRATVSDLDFLSVGWIIFLAIMPLLPWLLPRFGGFLKSVSPYVQSFKLGSVQLDFRAVRSQPVSVPTTGNLAAVPNDFGAMSSGTAISEIISSLRELRLQGGNPAAVIDLQDGRKWRLPNLYFLARLLEIDPVVTEMVFTEIRGGVDGYLIGTCRPDEFRRQVEQALPNYAAATTVFDSPAARDLTNQQNADSLASKFPAFQANLGPFSALGDADPVHGLVTPERIAELAHLSDTTVEGPGTTLSEQGLRAVLAAPYPFVPTTTNGRIIGLIDRNAVALAVARTMTAES